MFLRVRGRNDFAFGDYVRKQRTHFVSPLRVARRTHTLFVPPATAERSAVWLDWRTTASAHLALTRSMSRSRILVRPESAAQRSAVSPKPSTASTLAPWWISSARASTSPCAVPRGESLWRVLARCAPTSPREPRFVLRRPRVATRSLRRRPWRGRSRLAPNARGTRRL